MTDRKWQAGEYAMFRGTRVYVIGRTKNDSYAVVEWPDDFVTRVHDSELTPIRTKADVARDSAEAWHHRLVHESLIPASEYDAVLTAHILAAAKEMEGCPDE